MLIFRLQTSLQTDEGQVWKWNAILKKKKNTQNVIDGEVIQPTELSKPVAAFPKQDHTQKAFYHVSTQHCVFKKMEWILR